MRKWRPLDVPADDEWKVHYQIVVPQLQQNEILSLAHEALLAGHRGLDKPCDKILTHFFLVRLAT